MLHILIAELGSCLGGALVSHALGTTAIGYDHRVLILRKLCCQACLDSFPIQRSGHMALGIGFGAVNVDDYPFLDSARALTSLILTSANSPANVEAAKATMARTAISFFIIDLSVPGSITQTLKQSRTTR